VNLKNQTFFLKLTQKKKKNYNPKILLHSPPLLPRRARVVVSETIDTPTAPFTIVHVLEFTLGAHRTRPDTHTRHPSAHIAMTAEEYERCEALMCEDPAFVAAMAARGITDMSMVIVDPWGMGPDPLPDQKRMLMPLVFVRGKPGSNAYARPVDDIRIIVQLEPFKIVEMTDIDPRGPRAPVPRDRGSQYGRGADPTAVHPGSDADAASSASTDDDDEDEPRPVPQRRNPVRHDLRPYVVTQPDGPSYRVDGRRVRWQSWDLHVGFTSREGLVLNDVSYRGRSILHRVSFSEMIVPYGDPAFPNYQKNAFDAGEDGLGRNANSLRLGCDCLGAISYFDAHIVAEDGSPRTIDSAICLHEEDIGLLWKHTDWRTGATESRRYRRLVLSFITTIANYDYAHYIYLNQIGSIEFEVKLTGILSVSTSRVRAGLPHAGGEAPDSSPFGVAVAPGVVAPVHQHFFCVRLDPNLDDDPSANVYEVESRKPDPAREGPDPFGAAFVFEERHLTTEKQARRNVCVETSRHWKVASSVARNRLGERAAYRLTPGANCIPFVNRDSPIGRRAGFFFNHLWVTPFRRNERFPAGDFPNQRPSNVAGGLLKWTEEDRSIQDEDVVLWYTFGVTHIPRSEDWGVMPVERAGFKFEPCNFWDVNPSVDLPEEDDRTSVCVKAKL
jgi:primary-amine oxidase